MIWFANHSLTRLAATVCLCAVLGCASAKMPWGKRCAISNDLESRVGADLGPQKSVCRVAMPDAVNLEDGLSEDEAVLIGLWNNSAYQELLQDLAISQADVTQAAELPNPQVATLLPAGSKQWEFALSMPLDVVCLRPRRVAAAQLESERVAERLVQDGLNTVRDIRVAYVDWQSATKRFEIAEATSKLRDDIWRIAEARLEAGEIADFDVSPTRIDAMFGDAEVVRARREVDITREQLRFQLGLATSDVTLKPEPLPTPKPLDKDVEGLVAEAIAARPDIRAVGFAITAADERIALAKRDYFGFTGILPDIKANGREVGPGFQVNLPIFNQNQGVISRVRAEEGRLQAQRVHLCESAASEVRQSYFRYQQAYEDWESWQNHVLPQADSAIASAQAALKEDDVSLIVVFESTRQSIDAQRQAVDSQAQVRRALAELERSLGRRIDPAPVAKPAEQMPVMLESYNVSETRVVR